MSIAENILGSAVHRRDAESCSLNLAPKQIPGICGVFVAIGGLCFGSVAAGQTREQVVELVPGWNAVALEVMPEEADPDVLFGAVDAIVEVVAYVPASIPSSFLTDPGETLRDSASWPRWRRPGGGVELLNNLGAVQARIPYFVRASEPTSFTVEGRPVAKTWPLQTSGFSFVSFPVSDRAAVTLESYFSHLPIQPERVFRLKNDQWEVVGNAQLLQRNVVYCVRFNQAPPSYFGPVNFRNLPALSPLSINSRSNRLELDYRAFSPERSVGLTVEKVSGDLELGLQDGFLAAGVVPLEGAVTLNQLGEGEAGRLFFQASNFGSAVLRMADAEERTAFYTIIEHPNPDE